MTAGIEGTKGRNRWWILAVHCGFEPTSDAIIGNSQMPRIVDRSLRQGRFNVPISLPTALVMTPNKA